MVQAPTVETVMTAPSGLVQVPCVEGAEPVLDVGEGVGEGDGLALAVGLGDGDGDGLGDGEGDVLGAGAATVKLTVVVRVFPAASVARAVTLCEPAVRPVSGTDQFVVPDTGCQAPASAWTKTSRTPTLSDAVPVMVRALLVVSPL